jgi:protein-tyrosine phosphatase
MRELVRDAGLAADVEVDSAGTAGWHIGDPPDQRSVDEARRHGVPMAHRGRQFVRADFEKFDLVLVMDHDNRGNVLRMAADADEAHKVRFLRSFDPDADGEVQIVDPYYGSSEDFTRAFEEIAVSCRGLLAYIQSDMLG